MKKAIKRIATTLLALCLLLSFATVFAANINFSFKSAKAAETEPEEETTIYTYEYNGGELRSK